jgi:hypothetical protein
MIDNVLKTYSLEQLVDIAFPVNETKEWMERSHKGAFAKAVKGDENCPVIPNELSGEELKRARAYLEEKCKEFYEAPAHNM